MKLTEPEWMLMNALWRDHPATAREVEERLPGDVSWAYTTIKTMLSRLATKGAVREEKRGNVSVYQPLVSRDKARRSALGALLDRAFEGSVAPMLHFLVNDRKLSARQRKELIRILEEEGKKEGRSR